MQLLKIKFHLLLTPQVIIMSLYTFAASLNNLSSIGNFRCAAHTSCSGSFHFLAPDWSVWLTRRFWLALVCPRWKCSRLLREIIKNFGFHFQSQKIQFLRGVPAEKVWFFHGAVSEGGLPRYSCPAGKGEHFLPFCYGWKNHSKPGSAVWHDSEKE